MASRRRLLHGFLASRDVGFAALPAELGGFLIRVFPGDRNGREQVAIEQGGAFGEVPCCGSEPFASRAGLWQDVDC
jgi:hypothetical protein